MLNTLGFTQIIFRLEFCILKIILKETENRTFNLIFFFLLFSLLYILERSISHRIKTKELLSCRIAKELKSYSQKSHALVYQKENFLSFKIR